MFIAIVNASGFKTYLGSYESRKEAREAKDEMIKRSMKMGFKREDIYSEVVKLETLD